MPGPYSSGNKFKADGLDVCTLRRSAGPVFRKDPLSARRFDPLALSPQTSQYWRSMERPLRCRIGFHRWVRSRRTDPEQDNGAQSGEGESTCRYCGRAQGSGIGLLSALIGAAVIGAVAVWWFLSPMLGAVIMIGAVFGLFAVM